MFLLVLAGLKKKNLHTWLGGYTRHLVRAIRAPRVEGPRHLLFAFCDHYEPLWGDADREKGEARVRFWREQYPKMASDFQDADGNHPRHSFFFPGEQYSPFYLDALAELAKGGFGEVEFHLHHDGDTAAKLRRDLDDYLTRFARHGHLSRTPRGDLRFAFIHGNWALANGREDGRWCGVDAELPLLFEAGCYADFTFPSAPDGCQPNIVNQIYWPVGDLSQRRAYEHGEPARVGTVMRDRLLLMGGPIAISRRPGRLSLRIESAAVTAADPATPSRIASWVNQNIHVLGRPDWVFVKVHTHGAPDDQAASLLGDAGRAMHQELTSRYNDGRDWVLHYVTAREMFNIGIAAMAGERGDPALYRDYVLSPPPCVREEAKTVTNQVV